MVAPGNMGGADVLLPQWDVIRPAVRHLSSISNSRSTRCDCDTPTTTETVRARSKTPPSNHWAVRADWSASWIGCSTTIAQP